MAISVMFQFLSQTSKHFYKSKGHQRPNQDGHLRTMATLSVHYICDIHICTKYLGTVRIAIHYDEVCIYTHNIMKAQKYGMILLDIIS